MLTHTCGRNTVKPEHRTTSEVWHYCSTPLGQQNTIFYYLLLCSKPPNQQFSVQYSVTATLIVTTVLLADSNKSRGQQKRARTAPHAPHAFSAVPQSTVDTQHTPSVHTNQFPRRSQTEPPTGTRSVLTERGVHLTNIAGILSECPLPRAFRPT